MKMIASQNSQKGSALFVILIGVVLFAALSYAVSEMMRGGLTGGSANISREKTKLYASEIVDYGRAVRQAVQSLKINGCRDTEISFQNSIEAGYANGTNTECYVFHGDGGSMIWATPAIDTNDGSPWLITGANHVDNIGTSAAELVLILPNITDALCTEINDITEITALGSDTGIDFTPFTGSFGAAQTIDAAADNMNGCLNFNNGSSNQPFYYQVLIAR